MGTASIHRALPPSDLHHILAHTDGVWDALRGKSIFITGGTGFIGTWLVESLLYANEQLSLNCRVTLLSRNPDRFTASFPHIAASRSVQLVKGDVRDFPADIGRFDFIIHAATDVADPVGANSYLNVFEVNVDGTRRVLELARASGSQGVLLTSSGAVYGRQPPTLPAVSEDYPGAPDSLALNAAYGLGKRAAEWLTVAHHKAHGVPTKIARCFAFVGPHLPLDKQFAIGNFIRDAMQNETIRISGDGTPVRSYLYAADLAIWLWTILVHGRSVEAYNVGSDQELSIAELASVVAEVCHSTGGVSIAKQAIPELPVERYVPAIDKARNELGLRVWVELKDAISRTVNWHEQQS
ncbi:MAG: NAD-dependent epimerase/dehydratase family protein [Pseudogulbenkiania sp.]|nr:NAD-dependent epimerase/dehydratase family protein [Pseudogulbenkiania sp.]